MSLPKAKTVPFPHIKRTLPKNEAERSKMVEKVKKAIEREEEYLARERQKQHYFSSGFFQQA